MTRTFILTLAAAAALATIASPRQASAQNKALVYCSPTTTEDVANCGRMVAALSSGGWQVRRAFDGSTISGETTVNLTAAGLDLSEYRLFVVPSLADMDQGAGANKTELRPYAILRNATAQANLSRVLRGRVAAYSGDPEQVTDADQPKATGLIQRAATWTGAGTSTGLLVFLDVSNPTISTPYGWVSPIAGVQIVKDPGANFNSLQNLSLVGQAFFPSPATNYWDMMASDKFAVPTGGFVDARSVHANTVQQNNRPVLISFRQQLTALALTPSTATINIGGSYTFSATLTTDGSPLGSRTVTFRLNGVDYAKTTDASGVATLSNTDVGALAAGTYTVQANFGGAVGTDNATSNLAGSRATATLTVNATQATAMTAVSGSGTFGGTANLTAKLTAGGTAVASQTVTFKVNGNAVCGAAPLAACPTTDASGVASLSGVSLVGITAGTHTDYVEAIFAGAGAYLASSAKGTLQVGQATGSISIAGPSTIEYKATGSIVPTTIGDGLVTYAVTLGDGTVCSINTAGVVTMLAGTGTCKVKATLSAGTNYTGATSNELSITATKRAVTVTADAKNKQYGDADPALTHQVTAGSLLAGDSFSGTLARDAGESVGAYAIRQGTLSAGPNYDLTFVGANLTIDARTLTVTAVPKTKVYGAADPALTYSITSGSLSGTDQLTGSLTRAPGETVAGSPYAILQGTLTAGTNYNLTFVGADFTITPRPITVTADAQNKMYGAADPALTYQITSGNLVGADAFSGALTRVAGELVGTYAIQQGTVSAGTNYLLTFVGANLTIDPRPITVTADADQTKIYGDADPALTYAITSGNLVGADQLSGSLARAAGENVGSYAIAQGSLTAGTNYDLTYVGANFTINPRPITVTADAKTKVYGAADPALTYAITSGSLSGTDQLTGSLTRAPGEMVAGSPYAILQGTLSAGLNYELTYVGASFTITQRPITVTADAQNKMYGAADPALTYQITSGNLVGADAFSGALTRVAGELVGTYAIQQGTLTAGTNYALTFVGANLTIQKLILVVGPITAPTAPLQLGTSQANVAASAGFNDTGLGSGNYSAVWNWGNGTTSAGNITKQASGPYAVTGTHTYTTTGVHRITLTVTENDGTNNARSSEFEFVVIYDPSSGFVTGGGWINSPAGACRLTTACEGAIGKATFGFVAKYLRGATTPTGNTEFQFHAGNLNFKSTVYEWLVVSGSTKAQYKGTGTINGGGNYGFMLSVIDGDNFGNKKPDTFRIRIWDKNNGDAIVYDNEITVADETADPTTILGGGSIQIQTK